MTILREASTMYASMFSLVLFMALFESRYPRKKTVLLTLGLMGPLLIVNFVLLAILGPVTMSTLLLLTCSLPSLVFFFFMAKFRDGRLLFTFCIADTVMLMIIDLTSIADFFLGNTYIVMAVSRLILCPLVAILAWKLLRPLYLDLQNKVTRGWFAFAIIALLFYILMSMAMSVPTIITQRLEQLPAFLLILVLIPVIYIHIFRTLVHQQRRHESSKEENILQVQVTSLQSRLEEYAVSHNQHRQERHDFRHKLRTMAALAASGKYDQLQQLAREYEDNLNEAVLDHYCDHPILDAVLASYLAWAKYRGIAVSVALDFPGKLQLNESELATVFANALENAIHACEGLPGNQRMIEVKVLSEPRFMIQIRNSFDGVVAFDDEGIPISPRPGHGFGTRSIVTFCQKNGAFFSFSAEDREFFLKILF